MMIGERIGRILDLLEKIRRYERVIAADNFEPATVADMKGNAKDFCDQAKAEIDQIKSEIDEWS